MNVSISLLLLLGGAGLAALAFRPGLKRAQLAFFVTMLLTGVLLYLTLGSGPEPEDRVTGGNYGGALFSLNSLTSKPGVSLTVGGCLPDTELTEGATQPSPPCNSSNADDIVIRAGDTPFPPSLLRMAIRDADKAATVTWQGSNDLVVWLQSKDGGSPYAGLHGVTPLPEAMCDKDHVSACSLRQAWRVGLKWLPNSIANFLPSKIANLLHAAPVSSPAWRVNPETGECIADELQPLALGAIWDPASVVFCDKDNLQQNKQALQTDRLAVLRGAGGPVVVKLNALEPDSANLVAGDRLVVFAINRQPSSAPGLPVQPGKLDRVFDVRLNTGAKGLEWNLVAPPMLAATGSRNANRAQIALASAASPEDQVPPDWKIVRFAQLGSTFEAQLAATKMQLPGNDSDKLELSTPDSKSFANGRTLRIDGPKAEVTLRLWVWNKDYGSLNRLFSLAVIALLFNWMASGRLRFRQPIAMVLLATVDLLLVLRLTMATEAMVVNQDSLWLPLPANALLQLVSLPLALTLGWPQQQRQWRMDIAWCVAGAFCMGVLAWAAMPTGESSQTLTAIMLPFVACILAIWLPALTRWLTTWIRILLIGFTLSVIHLAFQERGLGIATTVLLVPGLVLLFGNLLALVNTSQFSGVKVTGWGGAIFWGVWLIVVATTSLLINDTGLAFALFWPFAVAAAWCWILAEQPVDHPAWTAPLSVAALGIAAATAWFNHWLPLGDVPWLGEQPWLHDFQLVSILSVLLAAIMLFRVARLARRSPGPLFLLSPIAVVATLAVALTLAPYLPAGNVSLAEANGISINTARLVGAFAPNRLAAAGTRAATEFEAAKQMMLDYADPSIGAGKGMYRMATPRLLAETQLSDHAAAVHLIYPFGKLVGLGVALLLAVPAVIALRARPAPDQGSYWQAILAGLIFSLSSLYVLLVNLAVLPFTGRDMYLLAPFSGANPLEAGLLLLMLVQWLGRKEQGT